MFTCVISMYVHNNDIEEYVHCKGVKAKTKVMF